MHVGIGAQPYLVKFSVVVVCWGSNTKVISENNLNPNEGKPRGCSGSLSPDSDEVAVWSALQAGNWHCACHQQMHVTQALLCLKFDNNTKPTGGSGLKVK